MKIIGIATIFIFSLITLFGLYSRGNFVRNTEQKESVLPASYSDYVSDNIQNYTIKNGEVFYYNGSQLILVDGVAPSTFTALTSHYAKDQYHIYINGEIFNEADFLTFHTLNEAYAKDKNHVYYRNKILADADTPSFIPFGYWYGKDYKKVFYEDFSIKGADPETFVEFSGTEYTKDKNAVYLLGKRIEDADSQAFQILGQYYSKDENSVFYMIEKISQAKINTFSVIENDTHNYATDGVYVYEDGKIIKNANPKNFVPEPNPSKY